VELSFFKNMKTFTDILDAINAFEHEYSYRFIDNSEYEELIHQKKVREANKVYVEELLYRCHIAAITTLFRNDKWVQGIVSALQHNNYFVFSSSLRGLVEAAADSHYCLVHVPGTLRDHFLPFSSALQGKFDAGLIVCEKLEDVLIHYSHGKKQPKTSGAPASHFAKPSQEYLRSLDDPNCIHVRDLYSELCEVTHPAGRSVAVFIARESLRSQDYRIRLDLGTTLIRDLLERHDRAFVNVFQMSFNAALLSLHMLNRFKDKRFHTPGMAEVDLSSVPAFHELEEAMKRV
jgi:hypothetical protein